MTRFNEPKSENITQAEDHIAVIQGLILFKSNAWFLGVMCLHLLHIGYFFQDVSLKVSHIYFYSRY